MTTHLWLAGALLMHAAQTAHAPNVGHITPVRGLVVAETERGENGEREALTTIEDVSAAGVRYGWRYRDMLASGDTVVGEAFRFVSAADLARAPRAHFIYDPQGPTEHPGTTAWSVSSAVYRQLAASGSADFQIMSAEPPAGSRALAGLGFFRRGELVPVRWRGTLTRVAATPELFPVLMNGRRVSVPALHARGRFTGRGQQWTPELWVLADSAYPMLLKVLSVEPPKVLQIVRIDLPDESNAAGAARTGEIERDLASACRVELPGVYFAYNSAALDPASDRAIASIASVLARHRDWTVVVEGHTDSIGGDAANRALSERRAAAVRERLVTGHRVEAARIRSAGYGAAKPREPNATIEGRARNRRVELVRNCGGAR